MITGQRSGLFVAERACSKVDRFRYPLKGEAFAGLQIPLVLTAKLFGKQVAPLLLSGSDRNFSVLLSTHHGSQFTGICEETG